MIMEKDRNDDDNEWVNYDAKPREFCSGSTVKLPSEKTSPAYLILHSNNRVKPSLFFLISPFILPFIFFIFIYNPQRLHRRGGE